MDEEHVITGPTIAAYDLAPLAPLLPPFALLRDAFRSDPYEPRPRYVPGPLPEGMARVVFTEGEPYDGPTMTSFREFSPGITYLRPDEVFEIPAEQVARWQAATDAYEAAVEEMDALISERAERRQG